MAMIKKQKQNIVFIEGYFLIKQPERVLIIEIKENNVMSKPMAEVFYYDGKVHRPMLDNIFSMSKNAAPYHTLY